MKLFLWGIMETWVLLFLMILYFLFFTRLSFLEQFKVHSKIERQADSVSMYPRLPHRHSFPLSASPTRGVHLLQWMTHHKQAESTFP